MNKLDFTYLKAKNIFCFGSEGIEIDFTKFGNIVRLDGENLDVQEEEEIVASNGVGKSSIPECLVYGLYGEPIKSPTKINKDDVVNKKNGKGLYVEVIWNNFRVVRKRMPNSLRLWESDKHIWNEDTELTLGGMPATQALIEQKIGLSYHAFTNLLVFTDNNSNSFLECNAETKRAIVENLLALQEFNEDHTEAKESAKACKIAINLSTKLYEQALSDLSSANRQLSATNDQEKKWKQDKELELQVLIKSLVDKKKDLESSSLGQQLQVYMDAQNSIKELSESFLLKENIQTKFKGALEEARVKLEQSRNSKNQLDLQLQKEQLSFQSIQSEVSKHTKLLCIKELAGTVCPHCYGIVDEKNFGFVVESAESEIKRLSELLIEKNALIVGIKEESEKQKAIFNKQNELIKSAESKEKVIAADLNKIRMECNRCAAIQKPELGVAEKVIEEKINQLEQQIESKRKEIIGPSPYVDILKTAELEIANKTLFANTKKTELDEETANMPYHEYWVGGYSPKGAPKMAITRVIPRLNEKIAYWLQFLIDGKIKLTFDNDLVERIERNPSDGDPYIYQVMSGGERRRLNLAVSQAFAHLMMIGSKTSPSIVFLDEVTTNIDPIGVIGVYNMLMQLSKEKKVFVSTHDQGLIDLLSGCEAIYLQKKGNVSKIVNK